MSDIYNKGIHVLNPSPENSKQKTLVVMGVARSGTSMVAIVLHHLGVNMGIGRDDVIYERPDVYAKLENKKMGMFKKFVEQQNNTFSLWGWKRPKSIEYVRRFESIIRNPHYVIPFRDLLAIATRNNLTVDANVQENLFQVYRNDYRKVIRFLHRNKKPTFLFSYEKAITDPNTFVRRLAEFIGIDSEENIFKAINAIQPNQEEYVKRNVSIHKGNTFIGRFDRIKNSRLVGWAKLTGSSDPVELDLHINKNFQSKIIAGLSRPDLEKLKYGACAFEFDLRSLDLDPDTNHRIDLYFPNGEKLVNSPLFLADNNR